MKRWVTIHLGSTAVGIGDEVDSHIFIFVGDASHCRMAGISFVEFVGAERKVELFVSEVIRLGAVAHPCEFELESAYSILKVDNYKTSILGVDTASLFEVESFAVKSETLFKIKDVEILVDHLKHNHIPFW